MKIFYYVLFSILLFGCSENNDKTIVFGFIPSTNIEEVESVTDSLCIQLSKQTGLSIKAFVAPDYASLIESIRTRHVQIAWFAPMSFVEAERETKLFPLLTSVRGGKPYFYSGVFVRKDKNINSIFDLKGKIMGFTDPSSTAGRIFPEAEFRRNGIIPETFFKQVVYLGGHDKVVAAVLEGSIDAGASFANDTIDVDNAWHQFIKNQNDVAKIKPLFFSKPIPGDVIACLESIKKEQPDQISLLTEKLLDYSKTAEGKVFIKKLNRTDSLVPANHEDYEIVREIADLVLVE